MLYKNSTLSLQKTNYNIIKFLLLSALGSVYLALMSQVAIMLNPVPVTLQTFAVLTLAVAGGYRLAISSVIMYLTQGALGLPVFAGGTFGLAILFGPTGGYLLGFIVYAFFYGLIKNKNLIQSVALVILAEALLFACGLAWLGLYVGYNTNLLALGFYPFVVSNLVKGFVGLGGYTLVKSVISKIKKA